jgi:hypothetical protein
MKAFVIALALFGSSSAFAAQTTVDLNPNEIQSMISIFDRSGVKGSPSNGGACFGTEAQISTVSYSMNPASWTISQNSDSKPLVDSEIKEAIALFDRLPIKPSIEGGVKFTQVVTISESSCGMSPAHWTATFEAK